MAFLKSKKVTCKAVPSLGEILDSITTCIPPLCSNTTLRSSSALRLAIISTASLPTGFSFTGIFWNLLLHWQNSPSSITTIFPKDSTYLLLCCCSVAQSCPTLCNTMNCSTPAFPVLHHLPELAQTHIHWVGDAIQPSHPLSSPSLALNLSQHQGLFQWVSSLHQVTKVLEFFSFSISPSNEYSGLISFRMDWLDLLAVQGILKSLLQHHSSKASIHRCSAFFMVLLSHPYMTTGKTSSFYSHIWDVKLVFAYCLLYLDSWFIGGPHFVVVL